MSQSQILGKRKHSGSSSSSSDQSESSVEYTETYLLYKKHREEKAASRLLAHEKKILMQTNTLLNLRKLDLKDFPNYKKLLVVMNIPFDVSENDVCSYFKGVVCGSNHQVSEEPITAVKRYSDLGIVSLEFRKKQDSEICLMLDDVREFSNEFKVKMRIFRTKRFITHWNDILKTGGNPLAGLLEGANCNFKDNYGGFSAPT